MAKYKVKTKKTFSNSVANMQLLWITQRPLIQSRQSEHKDQKRASAQKTPEKATEKKADKNFEKIAPKGLIDEFDTDVTDEALASIPIPVHTPMKEPAQAQPKLTTTQVEEIRNPYKQASAVQDKRLLELEKKMASMEKNLQTTNKTVKRIDNNSILLINKVKDIDKTNSKLVKSVEDMGNHFKRFMDDLAKS